MKKTPILVVFLLVLNSTISAQCFYPAKLSTDGQFNLAIKSDGTLWAWGKNSFGELGDNSTSNKSVPTQIGTDNNWLEVAAGTDHSVAIKTNGTLWAWGRNTYGQVGDGTTIQRRTPTQISTATDWQSISAGTSHTLAIKTDGTLWAWGRNHYGQLGNNANNNINTPTQIGTESNWRSIHAGSNHNLATKNNGTLWAWGRNDFGQLGDNTSATRKAPVQIGNSSNWSQISAGGNHNLAIRTNGSLWSWGANTYGQVGDNTVVIKFTPTLISSAIDWKSITAGGSHSLAIKNDGSLYSWGQNTFGQLGNVGSSINNRIPFLVGKQKNWKRMFAGFDHTLALQSDNSLIGFGGNSHGQVGNNSAVSSINHVNVGIGSFNDISLDLALATTNNNSSVLNSSSLSSQDILDGESQVRTTSNCKPICLLEDLEDNQAMGTTTVNLWTLSTAFFLNNQPASLRYFEIKPTNNTNCQLTLFQTQDDFNKYNALSAVVNNTWDALPFSKTDNTGMARIRVTQIDSNTSSSTAITPDNVMWNELKNRWEIKFSTNQYGNFYIHVANPNNSPLENNFIEASKSNFLVYPNPTQNKINLEWKEKTPSNTTILLSDLSGRVIKKVSSPKSSLNQKLSLNLAELRQGIYFIQVYQNNQLLFSDKVSKN